MSFIPLLQAAASGAGANQGGMLMTVMPFVLIIAIFYFFIIRPQNKKQKETQKMIDALKKGDKVVTIGGIHGVVSATKEKTVIVKVDGDTKIEFSRSAISAVEADPSAAKKTEKPAKAKKEEKPAAETASETSAESASQSETPAEENN